MVADEWICGASIHVEVLLAEEDVSNVDAESAADAEQTKERSIHIRKFDRLKYSIESVIYNLARVTEVSCPLRAVFIAHNKTFEESIRVDGFEKR